MTSVTQRRQIAILFLILATVPQGHSVTSDAAFSQGVQLYKQRQWRDALGQFLNVLQNDPRDTASKRYVDAIAKELSLERAKTVEEQRIRYLGAAAQDLGESPSAAPLRQAVSDIAHEESNRQEAKWQRWLEEARLHRDLGHLLPANDLVLRLLSENPSHGDGLRELSELQSRLRDTLDHSGNLLIEERYSCEGFYAYGQADYPAALTAWDKARLVVQQSAGSTSVDKRLGALHFLRYEEHARATLNAEKRTLELKQAFTNAVTLYKREHFEEALDAFRKLAIQEPDYPQLAFYLVQSETGAEKNRAHRLGERKRKELDALFEQAVKNLEAERYGQAEQDFTKVLALDPSHSRAQAYLAIAKSENQKRHDPKAAQLHYESGLVAYASGKLDEAQREWTVTLRMNPTHEKARVALAKVQKELAMSNPEP